MKTFRYMLSVSAVLSALALCAPPAAAQQAAANAPDDTEVVVTGTLLRGVAPTGAPVIGLSEEQITKSGVTSSDNLLRQIPQLGGFNSVPTPTTNGVIPFQAPNIRGLGGLSGMTTLVLLDGHRIVPSGIGLNWIDSAAIPAGILSRVEIIPDGGSSIYGSDAVGGVINFITRKKVDRPEITAKYGIGAGDYKLWDIGASAGLNWDSGSLSLSYSYSDREALFGRDLDYLQEDQSSLGGVDNRAQQCSPGNVVVGTTTYPLPGTVAGVANRCALAENNSFFPEEQRHSVFVGLAQDMGRARFDLSSFVSRREVTNYAVDNLRQRVTINAGNPFFVSRGGATSQDVLFTYADAFGVRANANPSTYLSWGITPTLTIDIGDNWSLRTSFNLGQSEVEQEVKGFNSTAQTAALTGTTATALNPYNPAATNAAVLAAIRDQSQRSSSDQQLAEARVVLDGTLFSLPGGDVKLALGGESHYESIAVATVDGPRSVASPAPTKTSRNVDSAFAEVHVPIVGAGNTVTGINALDLSLSTRYDSYSDVGETTNSRFAFAYKPVETVTLRGSWGTSFHAPALADLSARLEYIGIPVMPFPLPPGSPPGSNFRPTLRLQGATAGIKPETADTWTFGLDFKPSADFQAGVTYWNIDYQDRVDQNAGYFFGGTYYTDPTNAPFYLINPANVGEIIAKFGNAPVAGFPNLATFVAIFGNPIVVSDQRKQNLGALRTNGIDFNARWTHDFNFGALDASLNGTYLLTRESQSLSTQAFVDNLKVGSNNAPIAPLTLSGSVGLRTGPFYVSGTALYTSSADVGPTTIDSLTTVNMFGSYELNERTQLTLNVDNVFDQDPPFRIGTTGVANIVAPRLVTVGLRARF